MLEAVVNISEGTDQQVLDRLRESCAQALLDLHTDTHHNRSVFTLAGPDLQHWVKELALAAMGNIDMSKHLGVHPRIGAIDVVPFVPIESRGGSFGDALAERDRFAEWLGGEHHVPCFLYGSGILLPEIRRDAFEALVSHTGPQTPHPTAGSCAVGARSALIAYNLWIDQPLAVAQSIAKRLRQDGLRTLGLQVGELTQVSCNLVDPKQIGPGDVFDLVLEHSPIERAELVGLVPYETYAAIPRQRRKELDICEEKTIEARLTELNL